MIPQIVLFFVCFESKSHRKFEDGIGASQEFPFFEPRMTNTHRLALGPVSAGEVVDAASDIYGKAICKNPQLCTHQIILTDSHSSDRYDKSSFKFLKNVPLGKTVNFQYFGTLTTSADYLFGAYLNLMIKTTSDASGQGHLKSKKMSSVQYIRYTPKK